jgi:DNA-binding NarL/FixJ family response regulator
MAVRIFLVDDHPIVRQGLKTLMEGRAGWEVIEEISDGAEALQKASDLKPEIMVLGRHHVKWGILFRRTRWESYHLSN